MLGHRRVPENREASPPPTEGAGDRLLERAEADLYDEWKRHGSHLEEYASEFIGTVFSVFCVVGVVAGMFGGGSPVPHAIPSAALRLFLTGLLLGERAGSSPFRRRAG